jgi:acetylornithine/N-succinyldiaminopimelate aminotransferase
MTDLTDFETYLTPNYGTPPILITQGSGCELTSADGETYLDFAGGIAVSALGHCHPALIQSLTAQAQKVWHLSNTLANEPAIELAKALVNATTLDQVFFCNSGAEANEAAIKAARRYASDRYGSEKDQIVCFHDAFHGRTIATVTAGGQDKYKQGFGPMPGGFHHIPFNDCQALEAAISERTCAVMVEPIQGEGGVRPICPTLFRKIRAACDRVDAVLIVDEVQSGMGRTGQLFAHEHAGVEPDILTSAKSLGCGFPIGATLCKRHVAEHLSAGTHGSTYGGNPMATAIALTALSLINQADFLQQVKELGLYFKAGLARLNDQFGLFETIRGRGLLIGAVLNPRYAGRANELVKRAHQEHLLTLVAGPNVHRFAPPLIISETHIDDALSRLERVYATFTAETPADMD